MDTKLTPEYIKSPEFLAEATKVPKIIKKHLTNGQYYAPAHEKTCLFLHHTAGTTAQGAWGWWNQTPDRVGTPYLIDRNGDIYECFDPKSWAYHLGIKGDDDSQEKQSISIEIVAAGHLYGDDNNMFLPLYPNTAAGKKIPDSEICVIEKGFRGYTHFQAYTDAQIISLCQLVGKIHADFPTIPFPSTFTEKVFEYNPDIINKDLKGVFTHTSVRKDKDDIIPQPNLLQALTRVFGLMTSKTKKG
jgi:N-acetyl-anhydromuramyl-L-alanine amidase AmpD